MGNGAALKRQCSRPSSTLPAIRLTEPAVVRTKASLFSTQAVSSGFWRLLQRAFALFCARARFSSGVRVDQYLRET
jgi:hypothetical protein